MTITDEEALAVLRDCAEVCKDEGLHWTAERIESAIAYLTQRLAAVDEDAALLDALESDIGAIGPILLHNGVHEKFQFPCRGLGIANTGRTLRQAVAQLTAPSRQEG